MLQALDAQILQIQNHPCLQDFQQKLLRAARYAEKDLLFTPIVFLQDYRYYYDKCVYYRLNKRLIYTNCEHE